MDIYINDRFRTNLINNSTQDHVWSIFLIFYSSTSITISIFDISLILNIQLHSHDPFECNFPLNSIFDIVVPYKSLCLSFWGYAQNPKSNFFISQKSLFFSHIVVGIYIENSIHAGHLCINPVRTKYVQEKCFCELIVSLSMLFVKFLYIPENFILVLRLLCNL